MLLHKYVHSSVSTLFVWLISHQPAVLFSQNKPATSNQPQPASSTFLSEQISTSHQPKEQETPIAVDNTSMEQQHTTHFCSV
jgi:hypothetical protein